MNKSFYLKCVFMTDSKQREMSSVMELPLIGHKIFVPGCFSHKEGDDPVDEYFMLMDIDDPGDGVSYIVTQLVGGKYGRPSTEEDDTLHLNLEEFRIFRGYCLRKE